MGTSELTEQQLAMFKAVFDTWDSNQDGAIQKEQLGSLVKACGMNPSESELNDLVADLDTNKNGVIEFDEFLSLAAVLFKHGSEEILLRQAFAFFDKNQDGKISAGELQEVLTSCGEPLSEEEANELIEMGDVNGDGFLDVDEFIKVVQSFA